MSAIRSLLLLVAIALLGGCASAPAMTYAGSPASEHLKRNEGSRGNRRPYAYQADVNWGSYRRFMLEPVEIYRDPQAQFNKLSDEEQRQLAAHMFQAFGDTLAKQMEPVVQPGPGTLRIKLVLTGAKPTKRFISTAMKFDLAGGPYNAVQAARGKPGAMSGWVAYSVEVYDAQSDRLLATYLETQYPNAMNVKASAGRLTAAMTGVDKGALALAETLRAK